MYGMHKGWLDSKLIRLGCGIAEIALHNKKFTKSYKLAKMLDITPTQAGAILHMLDNWRKWSHRSAKSLWYNVNKAKR